MSNTFVVDASTTLKWIFEDEIDSEKAVFLLKEHLREEIRLTTPNIWVFEIANSIKTSYIRKKTTVKGTNNKLKAILKCSPYLVNIEREIDLCLENALKYQISVYDSTYVTLAKINNIVLISSDTKLVNKINDPKIAINLKDYGVRS